MVIMVTKAPMGFEVVLAVLMVMVVMVVLVVHSGGGTISGIGGKARCWAENNGLLPLVLPNSTIHSSTGELRCVIPTQIMQTNPSARAYLSLVSQQFLDIIRIFLGILPKYFPDTPTSAR